MSDIKLLLLHRNTRNHLTICKKNELKFVGKGYLQNMFTNHIFNIYI